MPSSGCAPVSWNTPSRPYRRRTVSSCATSALLRQPPSASGSSTVAVLEAPYRQHLVCRALELDVHPDAQSGLTSRRLKVQSLLMTEEWVRDLVRCGGTRLDARRATPGTGKCSGSVISKASWQKTYCVAQHRARRRPRMFLVKENTFLRRHPRQKVVTVSAVLRTQNSRAGCAPPNSWPVTAEPSPVATSRGLGVPILVPVPAAAHHGRTRTAAPGVQARPNPAHQSTQPPALIVGAPFQHPGQTPHRSHLS